MKTLIKLLLVVILVALSFYFGAKVGAYKTWVLAKSLEAVKASSEIENKFVKLDSFESAKEYDKHLDDERYADIYDALRQYGQYLNHWSSKVPILSSTDRDTLHWYQQALPTLEKRGKIKFSSEESVNLTINEMIEDGQLDPKEADQMSSNILPIVMERQENIERAIEYINE